METQINRATYYGVVDRNARKIAAVTQEKRYAEDLAREYNSNTNFHFEVARGLDTIAMWMNWTSREVRDYYRRNPN